jgi:hypothetical protein
MSNETDVATTFAEAEFVKSGRQIQIVLPTLCIRRRDAGGYGPEPPRVPWRLFGLSQASTAVAWLAS